MPITWPSPDTRWPTASRRTLAPTSAISPAYSWPIVIGVGIVFCAHSSQLKMWMSVPQMPVLWTLTSTSSGPIAGIGSSLSQRPGSGFCLTRAFMGAPVVDAVADRVSRARSATATISPALAPRPRRPRSRSRRPAAVSAADIWVRMRAAPFGTTGKKKPAT